MHRVVGGRYDPIGVVMVDSSAVVGGDEPRRRLRVMASGRSATDPAMTGSVSSASQGGWIRASSVVAGHQAVALRTPPAVERGQRRRAASWFPVQAGSGQHGHRRRDGCAIAQATATAGSQ